MRLYDPRSTAEKVRDCRDVHGLSIDEAKRIVYRDELRDRIIKCEDVHDLKQVLLEAFPALDHANEY
jgi:hypothetical protein